MRRLIIAGTGSGCGKTTVSLALMRSLEMRGHRVAPFKTGPDYIDPGFHRAACGRVSNNLDAHLMGEADIRWLMGEACAGADIAVIEGVMGYYDGAGGALAGSTWDMARITDAPAVLVVDASGSAASAAAVALGFRSMVPESRIAGVIANRISSERHYALVRDAVRKHARLECVGWMEKDESLHLSSRQLGLVPAGETEDLAQKIALAASRLHMDWEVLNALTVGLSELPGGPWPVVSGMEGYRLGVALDDAFLFYYQANLTLLKKSGVTLVPFSPLTDAALPEGIDGLYIGGGYPEVFAARLSENESMRKSILRALEGGMRCYAECGGLMYLTRAVDGHPMVGFLDAECRMTGRLQRFGYCQVEWNGRRFPAHEFHRSVLEEGNVESAFYAEKAGRRWTSGYQKKNTLAQYPHAHFLSRPDLVSALWGRTP